MILKEFRIGVVYALQDVLSFVVDRIALFALNICRFSDVKGNRGESERIAILLDARRNDALTAAKFALAAESRFYALQGIWDKVSSALSSSPMTPRPSSENRDGLDLAQEVTRYIKSSSAVLETAVPFWYAQAKLCENLSPARHSVDMWELTTEWDHSVESSSCRSGGFFQGWIRALKGAHPPIVYL